MWVDGRRGAGYEVGAEVVVARGCKLHVERHEQVGALEHLGGVAARRLLVEPDAALAEAHGGGEAQGEVLVQSQLAQHAHGEARAVGVDVGVPLLTRRGVDEPVVLHLHVLNLHAKEEAPVEAAIVEIGPVLNLAGLGVGFAN